QAGRSPHSRAAAAGSRLGAGRTGPGPDPDLPLRRLLQDHGVRERPGLGGPCRGPPPGPGGALRPRRGALFHPRRGRVERERLHLCSQGFGPDGVILMNIQIRVAVTAAVLTLAGCGGSSEPAAPVAAPTEVAAVKTPPPVYPIE